MARDHLVQEAQINKQLNDKASCVWHGALVERGVARRFGCWPMVQERVTAAIENAALLGVVHRWHGGGDRSSGTMSWRLRRCVMPTNGVAPLMS
jgi:hypothetical protein